MRRVPFILMWGVCLVIVGCPTVDNGTQPTRALSPEEVSPRALEHYTLGVEAYQEAAYEDALIDFLRAVEEEPNFALAHFKPALIYYQRGQVDKEIAEYRKVILLEPDFFEAHLNLAHAHLTQGDLDRAEREYLWIIDHRPTHGQSLYNLGLIHEARGNHDDAIDWFERYLAGNPNGAWASVARRHLAALKAPQGS